MVIGDNGPRGMHVQLHVTVELKDGTDTVTAQRRQQTDYPAAVTVTKPNTVL